MSGKISFFDFFTFLYQGRLKTLYSLYKLYMYFKLYTSVNASLAQTKESSRHSYR
jgi:hypothetical protein